jgi:hypothetical protein
MRRAMSDGVVSRHPLVPDTIADKTLNVTGLALEVKLVSTSTAHVTNTYVIQGIITGFCD